MEFPFAEHHHQLTSLPHICYFDFSLFPGSCPSACHLTAQLGLLHPHHLNYLYSSDQGLADFYLTIPAPIVPQSQSFPVPLALLLRRAVEPALPISLSQLPILTVSTIWLSIFLLSPALPIVTLRHIPLLIASVFQPPQLLIFLVS